MYRRGEEMDWLRTTIHTGGMLLACATAGLAVWLLGQAVPMPDGVVIVLAALLGAGIPLVAVALEWRPLRYRDEARDQSSPAEVKARRRVRW